MTSTMCLAGTISTWIRMVRKMVLAGQNIHHVLSRYHIYMDHMVGKVVLARHNIHNVLSRYHVYMDPHHQEGGTGQT